MLVLSSYPLFTEGAPGFPACAREREAERRRSGNSQRRQFGSEYQEGVYEAARYLLGAPSLPRAPGLDHRGRQRLALADRPTAGRSPRPGRYQILRTAGGREDGPAEAGERLSEADTPLDAGRLRRAGTTSRSCWCPRLFCLLAIALSRAALLEEIPGAPADPDDGRPIHDTRGNRTLLTLGVALLAVADGRPAGRRRPAAVAGAAGRALDARPAPLAVGLPADPGRGLRMAGAVPGAGGPGGSGKPPGPQGARALDGRRPGGVRAAGPRRPRALRAGGPGAALLPAGAGVLQRPVAAGPPGDPGRRDLLLDLERAEAAAAAGPPGLRLPARIALRSGRHGVRADPAVAPRAADPDPAAAGPTRRDAPLGAAGDRLRSAGPPALGAPCSRSARRAPSAGCSCSSSSPRYRLERALLLSFRPPLAGDPARPAAARQRLPGGGEGVRGDRRRSSTGARSSRSAGGSPRSGR